MRTLTFKVLFYSSTADRGAFFAMLISPPERLGEVRRHAISLAPLPILQGGLLGEGELRQLSLRLVPTHQQ